MSFFKKLFPSGKENNPKKDSGNPQETPFKGVYREDAFNERYTEDPINPKVVDGCQKMIDSFFIEQKIVRRAEPKNHPANLDQVVAEGTGFHSFCKGYGFGDNETVAFLAYVFSDFLISRHGFVLYKDSTPEFPLRSATLKYNKNGVVLSLYPFEYAVKVLNQQGTFEELYARINSNVETLPGVDEILRDF